MTINLPKFILIFLTISLVEVTGIWAQTPSQAPAPKTSSQGKVKVNPVTTPAAPVVNAPIQNLTVSVKIGQGAPQVLVLLGKSNTDLRFAPTAGGGEMGFAIDQIVELRVIPNEALKLLQESGDPNQLKAAINALKPATAIILTCLDVPNSDLPTVVFAVCDAYRQVGKLDEAELLYNKLKESSDPATVIQASILSIYCLLEKGNVRGADDAIQKITPLNFGEPTFEVDKLVRGKIKLATGNARAAVNELAQAVVSQKLGAPLLPECMFVSAECYAVLGDLEVLKATLKKKELSDEEIEQAAKFAETSQGIYKDITKRFPNSHWGKKSQSKLPASKSNPEVPQ